MPSHNNKTIQYKNRFTPGFTIVEMLIVTAVVSIVSLAMFATFNNGMKIWQKASQQSPEEDLNIFLERLNNDLKNSFNFKSINFSGVYDSIEFVTLVNSPRLQNNTVGQVVYLYERQNKTIKRKQKDFSGIYENDDGTVTQFIEKVEALRFQYYIFDKERNEYVWKDEYKNCCLPLAVRVELSFNNEGKINTFTRTIGIPVASESL